MRRTIPTALAMTLFLGATPALAADETPAPDAATQRAESAELGFAVDVPADWHLSLLEGERISALTDAAGDPIMETTVMLANGGDGMWCDVDAYLDMTSALEEHAYAYVNYLQQSESAEAAMVVAETEIPAGPAYRIEIFDSSTGRIRGMYLFDGPPAEDGTFARYLLTCASRQADEPFWVTVAESVEFFEPVAAEDDAVAADQAPEATADSES